jgi:hypothetical protein
LGNVRNEMGVYWMNKCAQALKNFEEEATKVREKMLILIFIQVKFV